MQASDGATEIQPKTAALAYHHALGRLQQAVGRDYQYPAAFREQVFVPLIEALLWLDMMFDHPETNDIIDPDLRQALAFARNRSLHAWAKTIEFRNDVVLAVPMTSTNSGVQRIEPAIISDWCWRQANTIPGGKRPGWKVGKAEYDRLFAGRQVSPILDRFAEFANRVMLAA